MRELEDEIEGLTTRLERFVQENKNFEEQVKTLKHTIVEARDLIARYEEQQKHVRNNREYDSISKEIEYQTLEIEHAEKLIRESGAKLEMQKSRIEETEAKIASLKEHLETKKGELDNILEETRREHDSLQEKADQIVTQIEPRLLLAYRKIRERVRNGLAVVSIDRGSFRRVLLHHSPAAADRNRHAQKDHRRREQRPYPGRSGIGARGTRKNGRDLQQDPRIIFPQNRPLTHMRASKKPEAMPPAFCLPARLRTAPYGKRSRNSLTI